MKSMRNYIAIGLGIAIAFTGSNLAYGILSDTSTQTNTVKFKADLPELQLKLNEKQESVNNGNLLIKIPCELKGRNLYSEEKLQLKLNGSNTPLDGGTIVYNNSGYIEIRKDGFENNTSGGKYNINIIASLIGVDGQTRNLFNDNFSIVINSISKTEQSKPNTTEPEKNNKKPSTSKEESKVEKTEDVTVEENTNENKKEDTVEDIDQPVENAENLENVELSNEPQI